MYNDLIGKPFSNGGRGPDAYDCYGLAVEVFRRHGIELPDYRISCEDASRINQKYEEQRSLWVECDKNNLPIPSLVVLRFNSPLLINHVATYIGNGRMLHIAKRTGVRIEMIDHIYWRNRIIGFYVPRG